MRKLQFIVALLLSCCHLFAQNRTITGNVSNEKNEPLEGVTVSVKANTRVSTQTNSSGNFSISVPATTQSLIFSYIGYQTETVPINGTTMNVSLKPNENSDLESVVVTSYSQTKRSKFAGAASIVGKEKINLIPNASIDQILQGRAPGLLVTVGSGQPGAAARVQLRGQSSISGGSSPLYVMDGMTIEEGVFQSLNPNDIEDIQVLRDAVASAQYGNRGGSGVIVITTKKGKTGKPALSYNFQQGQTQPGKQRFAMMNTAQLLQFQEDLGLLTGASLPGWVYSQKNPDYAASSPAEQAARNRYLDSLKGIDVDWKDVFLRNGTFQSHDLNISGGGETVRYYVGAGYYDEDGIGIRSDLKRYTLRANLDIKTNKLAASFSNSIGYTRRNFIESENSITLANPFAAAYLGLPYQNLFNADGSVAVGSGKVGPNAYDRVVHGTSQFNDQIKANLGYNVNYDITRHFYIGGFAGVDYRQTINERSVYPNTYAANTAGFPVGPDAGQTTGKGSFAKGFNNFFQYTVRASAGYKAIIKERHDIDFKLISEYTDEKVSAFDYTGYGIDPKRLNTPAAITVGTVDNKLIPVVGGSKSARALYAAMALLNYTFDEKYTLNASFRRDASSQLAKDQRWVNFYAVGVTWNAMKEKFTSNWSKVNDLRVRLSYGTNANADGFYFGNFGYLPLFTSGTYAGVNTIIVPSNAGNLDVTWEVIKTANLGVDFGLFKSRVSGSVDVYNKTTDGNIIPQKISAQGGFGVGASIPVNSGKVVNKGVELNLTGDVIHTKNFTWTVGGNIAYNHNEVTDLGQVEEFEQGTELVKVGKPLGTHYIVKWAGVDAATGEPLYYTKDGKLTNVYSDDNRTSDFGTYNAPWIGGFNTSLRYQGFSLSAFFTFQKGFSRFNNQDFFQLNHAFAVQGFNMRSEMANMWKAPGDVTDIQSPLYQREFVSKDIQDASFLRFRNLNLAYDVHPKLLRNLKVVSGLRLYVQAQNLYTWTNWTGFDPEDDDNIAQYEYPTPRTITFGVQVSFQ